MEVTSSNLELLQALEDKAAYQERLKEEQLADQLRWDDNA